MIKRITRALMFIIIIVIGAICLLDILIPDRPIIIGNISYDEISYIYNGELKFTDETGKEESNFHLVIPVPIDFWGLQIPFLKKFVSQGFTNTFWSLNGESLGLLFSTDYPAARFPALLTADNKLLTCPTEDGPNTNYIYPIQVVNDNNILINLAENDSEKLVIYNMETCDTEKIFYQGTKIHTFSLSSKFWLAVNEEVDGDLMLNVYDNTQNLVLSINAPDYYEFITWSKDGEKLLYRISNGINDDYIYIYDFATGETTKIAQNVYKASFSPNGKQLVVYTTNGLFIMDLNTLQRRYLTNGINPDWRP